MAKNILDYLNEEPVLSNEPSQPMQPEKQQMLKNYLQSKMQSQEATPSEPLPDDRMAMLASGIGSALAGRGPDEAMQFYENRKKLAYDKELNKLKLAHNFEQDSINREMLANERDEKRKQQEFENAFKERQLSENINSRKELAQMRNADRTEAKRAANDLRQQERMTIFGEARTSEDAKKLKDAAELKDTFDRQLNEMISLREKHGGGATMNREDVNRGKQLSKDLLLTYKDLSKLGVLSQSDMSILNQIIPDDPLAYDFQPGQDSIMSNMQKFKKDTEMDFNSRLKNRLLNPPIQQPQIDPKVESFMKKNNISDPNEAIRILKEHGKI